MQGFTIAEAGHVVNVLPPVDIAGGVTGDRFKMNNYGHVSIIIQVGASAAAPTLTVKECTAASGGTATAIAFDYYAETTTGGDTLGARTAATSSGIALSANDNVFYVVELDARALSDGYNWVEVVLTQDSADSCMASVVAVLSGARYANDESATAIA